MPLNAACARRTYTPQPVRVRAEAIHRFVHALQESNPHFMEPQRRGGITAPPLYAVALSLPAVCEALGDPELGVPPGAILPLGSDFRFARPIRATREISVTASFDEISVTGKGEETAIRLQGTARGGVLFFAGEIRLLHPSNTDGAERLEPAHHYLRPPLAFRAEYRVLNDSRLLIPAPLDQARLETAEAFLGHTLGLCYAARAVIDASLNRDPAQLMRIAARPVRPLTPGESVVTAGWIREARRGTTFFGFEILAEDGSLVMADGQAEVMLK